MYNWKKWIKRLFKNSHIQEYPLAGRLQYFVKNWQIVTKRVPWGKGKEQEVYKQGFFREKERWRSQAGNKLQKFEQVSAIPSFQDRSPKRSKGLVATEQLNMQNRLEGCLFLYSTSQKLPEV